MTGFDVTQALERELAGHPMFGDTHSILHRARTLTLMQLEALSRGRPLVRELCRELRKEENRRAAADVLDDPVVRIGWGLLKAVRRGERSPSGETEDETEEVFAAVLHHLRHGPPGLPVAAGCRRHFRSRRSGPSITVWDPDVPETVVERRFASFADECFSKLLIPTLGSGPTGPASAFPEGRGRYLRSPEPGFVDDLLRGCDLLAILLPELSASVLDHVRLVGVPVDRRLTSITFILMPSTTIISGKIVDTPWRAAEVLLHEALHLKMMDLVTTRSLYRPGVPEFQDGTPTIRAIWRWKEQGLLADWLINQAWAAFHIYVHLSLFFARVERMEAFLADDFGTPPVPGGLGLERALGRAGYLGEELAVHVERMFGSDGRRLFAWLRRMLSCLCDADTLRGHVERLRGDPA